MTQPPETDAMNQLLFLAPVLIILIKLVEK